MYDMSNLVCDHEKNDENYDTLCIIMYVDLCIFSNKKTPSSFTILLHVV